jgi:hypothetical protein
MELAVVTAMRSRSPSTNDSVGHASMSSWQERQKSTDVNKLPTEDVDDQSFDWGITE